MITDYPSKTNSWAFTSQVIEFDSAFSSELFFVRAIREIRG